MACRRSSPANDREHGCRRHKRHNSIDLSLLSGSAIIGMESRDLFRNYDPVAITLMFWGEKYDIKALVNEANRLLPKVGEELMKSYFLRKPIPLASIAGGAMTGGGASAAKAAGKKKEEAKALESLTIKTPCSLPADSPSLKRLGEDIGEGLRKMFPDLSGCSAEQLQALADGIKIGAQRAPLPWGDNVLPPWPLRI